MANTSKPKKVKLRAFIIENSNITKSNSGLLEMLSKKLDGSVAQDRRMPINKEDVKKEEDLISDYTNNITNIHGAVLRIVPSGDILNIPDKLFSESKIIFSDLDKSGEDSQISCKEHYYFLLNDNYLISNLSGNLPIIRFQTYVNWYLEKERGTTLFEFTPKIISAPNVQMSQIKSINFQDAYVNPISSKSDDSFTKRIKNFSSEAIKSLMIDTDKFEELELNKIISAELLIKFKKPKEYSQEEYQKRLGAVLKPIGDHDSVYFKTINNGVIKSVDIMHTKDVEIETTSSGNISEPQIYQEMEKFLQELK